MQRAVKCSSWSKKVWEWRQWVHIRETSEFALTLGVIISSPDTARDQYVSGSTGPLPSTLKSHLGGLSLSSCSRTWTPSQLPPRVCLHHTSSSQLRENQLKGHYLQSVSQSKQNQRNVSSCVVFAVTRLLLMKIYLHDSGRNVQGRQLTPVYIVSLQRQMTKWNAVTLTKMMDFLEYYYIVVHRKVVVFFIFFKIHFKAEIFNHTFNISIKQNTCYFQVINEGNWFFSLFYITVNSIFGDLDCLVGQNKLFENIALAVGSLILLVFSHEVINMKQTSFQRPTNWLDTVKVMFKSFIMTTLLALSSTAHIVYTKMYMRVF